MSVTLPVSTILTRQLQPGQRFKFLSLFVRVESVTPQGEDVLIVAHIDQLRTRLEMVVAASNWVVIRDEPES